MPQLGSGPTLTNYGTGFYSVSDYQSILTYANQRHIVVIPEFDSPGHAHAAINSMLARYRQRNATNLTAAEEYLLSDLADTSNYESIQGFTDNAINPCLNSTYAFFGKVIRELKAMHLGHQNLTIYHFGGDEVPSKAWIGSPECERFKTDVLGNKNATSADFKKYFAMTMSRIVNESEVPAMACWEDGLYAGGEIINIAEIVQNETFVNVWDNVWELGSGKRAYELANIGYKVRMGSTFGRDIVLQIKVFRTVNYISNYKSIITLLVDSSLTAFINNFAISQTGFDFWRLVQVDEQIAYSIL